MSLCQNLDTLTFEENKCSSTEQECNFLYRATWRAFGRSKPTLGRKTQGDNFTRFALVDICSRHHSLRHSQGAHNVVSVKFTKAASTNLISRLFVQISPYLTILLLSPNLIFLPFGSCIAVWNMFTARAELVCDLGKVGYMFLNASANRQRQRPKQSLGHTKEAVIDVKIVYAAKGCRRNRWSVWCISIRKSVGRKRGHK